LFIISLSRAPARIASILRVDLYHFCRPGFMKRGFDRIENIIPEFTRHIARIYHDPGDPFILQVPGHQHRAVVFGRIGPVPGGDDKSLLYFIRMNSVHFQTVRLTPVSNADIK
jgi:hypothetical protein